MLALPRAISWLYRRDRPAAYGLLIFLPMLAPTSSVAPIKDALAERRMYVPMVGPILATIALSIRFRIGAEAQQKCAAAIPESAGARSKDPGAYELVWDLASAYECDRQPELAVSLPRSYATARPSAGNYTRLAHVEASPEPGNKIAEHGLEIIASKQ